MRIGIVGSRKIKDIDINIIMKEIPEACTEIVSGGAIGVDSLAQEIAKTLNLPIKVFLPQYEKYGRNAPLKRNEQISEYSDLVIAVWDYNSAGTRNTIMQNLKKDKKVKIIIL